MAEDLEEVLEWPGFPFNPTTEPDKEPPPKTKKSKKKARASQEVSEKPGIAEVLTTSPPKKSKSTAAENDLGAVRGGMFAALLHPPEKQKKAKKAKAGREEKSSQSRGGLEKLSPTASKGGGASGAAAAATPETLQQDRVCTVWNKALSKVVRGHDSATAWVAVALAGGEQLCAVGSARVRCLRGRVELLGMVLDGNDSEASDGRGSDVTVHAPPWHGAITMRALGTSSSVNDLSASPLPETANSFPVHLLIQALPVGSGYDLTNAVVDGNDANRAALRKRMPRSSSSRASNESNVKTEEISDDSSGITDAVDGETDSLLNTSELLALPGWCVLAGVEDRSTSSAAASALTAAAATPVVSIPKSWVTAADAVVAAHLRHLESAESRLGRARGDNDRDAVGTTAMVCGSKGTGKSSCARYLTHRLISARRDWLRAQLGPVMVGTSGKGAFADSSKDPWHQVGVSFLDLDVGQPEMTPPGIVSLHQVEGHLGLSSEDHSETTLLLGPPHTHLSSSCVSTSAYFFGDVTPRRDPRKYLSSAAALVDEHRARRALQASNAQLGQKEPGPGVGARASALLKAVSILQLVGTPLVVNCDGWVNGLGAAVLASLLRIVSPTQVLQIQGGRTRRFELPARASDADDMLGPGALPSSEEMFENTLSDANFDYGGTSQGDGWARAPVQPPPLWAPRRTIIHGNDASAAASASSATSGNEWLQGLDMGPSCSGIAGDVHEISSWDASDQFQEDLATQPQAQPHVSVSAVDLRQIRLAAYFNTPSAALVRNGALADPSGSIAAALSCAAPYVAPLSLLALDASISDLHEAEAPTEALHAFNGSLVAMVDTTVEAETSGWFGPVGPRCTGLGIVRSIDLSRGLLYMLTPAVDGLRNCRALVRPPAGSALSLPPALVIEPASASWPYLYGEAVSTAAGGVMKSRNNIQRGPRSPGP